MNKKTGCGFLFSKNVKHLLKRVHAALSLWQVADLKIVWVFCCCFFWGGGGGLCFFLKATGKNINLLFINHLTALTFLLPWTHFSMKRSIALQFPKSLILNSQVVSLSLQSLIRGSKLLCTDSNGHLDRSR